MPAREGAGAAAEPRSTKTEVIGVKELAAPEAEPRLQLLLAEGSENREEGKGERGSRANYCQGGGRKRRKVMEMSAVRRAGGRVRLRARFITDHAIIEYPGGKGSTGIMEPGPGDVLEDLLR